MRSRAETIKATGATSRYNLPFVLVLALLPFLAATSFAAQSDLNVQGLSVTPAVVVPGNSPIKGKYLYFPTVLVAAKWGEGSDEFGLIAKPEMEPIGPQSFAMGADGKIYILDSVKECIKRYSANGAYEVTLGSDITGSSMVVTSDGDIVLRSGYEILQYSQEGKRLSECTIPKDVKLVGGYAQGIRLDDSGSVSLNIIQTSFPVATIHNKKMEPLGAKAMMASTLPGFPNRTKSGLIRMDWKNDHLAVIQNVDSSGVLLQELPMTTSDAFGSVLFLGQDIDGTIFAELERISSDNFVHLEFRGTTSSGDLLTCTEVPNTYYTAVTKKLELGKDGSVFQMITGVDGVQVLVWRGK